MQTTLRVAWVAFAAGCSPPSPATFRSPGAVRPNFATRYAERAAVELRALALLPGPAPPDPRPALREYGWDEARIDEVRRALDLLNYGNPKYMLLIAASSEEI